jgi:hypothetical protein
LGGASDPQAILDPSSKSGRPFSDRHAEKGESRAAWSSMSTSPPGMSLSSGRLAT